MNFIFSSDHDDYIMALLGPGMLFNHHNEVGTQYFWWKEDHDVIPDASVHSYSPYSTYTDVYFKAVKAIYPGEEIFTSYGSDEWFNSRDIPYRQSPMTGTHSRSLKDLNAFGHCLTDVSIQKSKIAGAGQGLFAEKSFKAGEVVSIVPVLVMPKHILSEVGANSVLVNYAMSVPGSDVALFPLGRAAMVNNGGQSSNLKVQWYDWDSRRVLLGSERPSAVNERTVDELEASPYASLDICYIATQNIEKGEELTLFYGAQWENLWENYQNALESTSIFGNSPRPVFLEPVGLEAGMFPDSWMVSCIGTNCGEEDEDGIDESETIEVERTEPPKVTFDVTSLLKVAGKQHKVQFVKKSDVENAAVNTEGHQASISKTVFDHGEL